MPCEYTAHGNGSHLSCIRDSIESRRAPGYNLFKMPTGSENNGKMHIDVFQRFQVFSFCLEPGSDPAKRGDSLDL